jgi:hypothetical protein
MGKKRRGRIGGKKREEKEPQPILFGTKLEQQLGDKRGRSWDAAHF